MENNSSLTNDGLVLTFKNKEQMYLKTLYDDHSSKLLGIISLIVNDEARRMEILEKTFTRIYLEAKKYDPIHSSVFIWMMRVAISVSSEYLDIQLSEIQKKLWEVYKELRTKNQ